MKSDLDTDSLKTCVGYSFEDIIKIFGKKLEDYSYKKRNGYVAQDICNILSKVYDPVSKKGTDYDNYELKACEVDPKSYNLKGQQTIFNTPNHKTLRGNFENSNFYKKFENLLFILFYTNHKNKKVILDILVINKELKNVYIEDLKEIYNISKSIYNVKNYQYKYGKKTTFDLKLKKSYGKSKNISIQTGFFEKYCTSLIYGYYFNSFNLITKYNKKINNEPEEIPEYIKSFLSEEYKKYIKYKPNFNERKPIVDKRKKLRDNIIEQIKSKNYKELVFIEEMLKNMEKLKVVWYPI